MNARPPTAPLLLSLGFSVLLAACATGGGTGHDEAFLSGAEESTRTERNGDVITEFRIAGQLRAVRVQPSRGPVYYLYDRDGDGNIDARGQDNAPQTYFRLFEWE